MPKIIRILRSCSIKIFCTFPTVNISKLNFWLLICIAKNNFKGDFLNILIFLHPQIPDLQILSYHNKPYINGKHIWPLWLVLWSRASYGLCVSRPWWSEWVRLPSTDSPWGWWCCRSDHQRFLPASSALRTCSSTAATSWPLLPQWLPAGERLRGRAEEDGSVPLELQEVAASLPVGAALWRAGCGSQSDAELQGFDSAHTQDSSQTDHMR